MSPHEIDYTVNWLETIQNPYTDDDKLGQTQVDELVCNIMRSHVNNIPDEVNYKKNSGSNMNTGWGIAVSGVQIFNGLSAEIVDPFAPAKYADVLFPAENVESVDACLAHPQAAGIFHYHVAPTCIPDKATWEPLLEDRNAGATPIESARQVYTEHMPYRSVLGVSKDGRPIYTPIYSNGEEYTGCDVDVCNGMEIGGHYAYVSTFFHPYFMGCYGPGPGSDYAQACSQNPRICGDKAVVNMGTTMKGFGGWIKELFSFSDGIGGFFKTLFLLFEFL